MDERIKNIYKLMKDYSAYRMESWYQPMIERIQTQIDLHALDAKYEIPRWKWHRSSDSIWQNWTGDYFKEITRISRKIKEIKAELKKYRRNERAYKEAAEVLEVAAEFYGRDEEELRKHGVVPFRDRKHTKGVFRRADNNDDESGDE